MKHIHREILRHAKYVTDFTKVQFNTLLFLLSLLFILLLFLSFLLRNLWLLKLEFGLQQVLQYFFFYFCPWRTTVRLYQTEAVYNESNVILQDRKVGFADHCDQYKLATTISKLKTIHSSEVYESKTLRTWLLAKVVHYCVCVTDLFT